jgi:hypothetical protein
LIFLYLSLAGLFICNEVAHLSCLLQFISVFLDLSEVLTRSHTVFDFVSWIS